MVSQPIAEKIPIKLQGARLDKALAVMFPEHSRTSLQSWLDAGRILVNNQALSRRYTVKGGELVVISLPKIEPPAWVAENIPLDILYEDEDILVVNKPAGLIVHPGAGVRHGTMLNALLHHDSTLGTLPRAGIVHRLDKNTTGLLAVAKTEVARLNLIRQLKARTIKREYLAIVEGRIISGATIDIPVGRSRRSRKQMTAGRGKPAVSHYRVVTRYRNHTLVRVSLDTGRTHQIRVHLRYAGFPIVGDPDYGRRVKIPAGANDELIHSLRELRRQALHAERLEITHPVSGERKHWHAGFPEDLRKLVVLLKTDSS